MPFTKMTGGLAPQKYGCHCPPPKPEAPHKHGCRVCCGRQPLPRMLPAPRTKMAAAPVRTAAARRQLVGMLPECPALAWLPPSQDWV